MAIYREVHYHRHPHRLHITSALTALIAAAGGLIVLLLGVRFILSALEVDRLTSFASFVYSASYPLVAPFFDLFNYQSQLGVVRFEYQTLVAIVFWTLATWVLTRMINLPAIEE